MILSQENIKKVVQDYFKDKPVSKVYKEELHDFIYSFVSKEKECFMRNEKQNDQLRTIDIYSNTRFKKEWMENKELIYKK